ncbi:hypothetical protein [Chryseobacterium sp. StRB126]|uniref:hypothetical protein n=1 Tax=Chryseobacterium sp. StRB126 TaxID=878220 RepID=UPI0005EE35A7|nr:hypothetical protein [Chryseobacterium sp. StRB126]
MPTNPFFYFIIAGLLFFVISGVFFFIQKDKIIEKYRQPDAVILKKIYGTITTVHKGTLHYNKRFQWCSFDILLNENSIFLFPRSFYIVPRGCINLKFRSNAKNTKNPTFLIRFHLNGDSVELIYYPDHLLNGERTISLNGLNKEQILLFQKALDQQT